MSTKRAEDINTQTIIISACCYLALDVLRLSI